MRALAARLMPPAPGRHIASVDHSTTGLARTDQRACASRCAGLRATRAANAGAAVVGGEPATLRWALAWVALVLGLIGVVVPGLPTTPLVLLAAFAATRGSLRLDA